jgi:hypothetical protein
LIVNYFWIWRSFDRLGAVLMLVVLLFSAQRLLRAAELPLWQPMRPLAAAATTVAALVLCAFAAPR